MSHAMKTLNMADELTVEQYLTLQCEQLIKVYFSYCTSSTRFYFQKNLKMT